MNDTPLIQFFLPCTPAQFSRLPATLSDYPAWQHDEKELSPFTGRYHWVLQTYLHLKEAGAHVALCPELPEQGIIVSHFDCFEYGWRPTAAQYAVVLLVDREMPHPRGHLHVLHNPLQRLPLWMPSVFMRPWPQIGLIPRDAARGDRFENVFFIGNACNLDPAFSSDAFQQRLATIGLRLHVQPPDKWHDFSDVDAVLAIRELGRGHAMLNRPTIKLYNAWLAGVPIVVGDEPGCRSEGRAGIDYVEATSADEAFASLQALQSDVNRRRSLVQAGRESVASVSVPRLRADWAQLIRTEIVPRYERWRQRGALTNGRWALLGAVRERLFWRFPNWFSVRRPAAAPVATKGQQA